MKKIAFLLAAAMLGGVGLFVIMLIPGGSEAGKPIATPTTAEHANEYYSISNELGVPWDLALLIDTFLSNKEDVSMPEVNPMRTSLSFVMLEGAYEVYDEDEEGWHSIFSFSYRGAEAIFTLLGIDEAVTPAGLSAAIRAYEEGFYTPHEQRAACNLTIVPESTFKELIQTDYGDILTTGEIDDIMALYESGYLYELYFSDVMRYDMSDFTIPEVTVGSITRQELVKIALSLVNAPYLYGGKSPFPGTPISPLDCSGYVDWVYMQGFGGTVNDGWGGVRSQFYRCTPITADELRPGDIGFYWNPEEVPAGQENHIGIYIGTIGGKPAFVHCGGPYWGYGPDHTTGRVVVSINDAWTVNTANPLGGNYPYPDMNPSNFKLFGRPSYQFAGEGGEAAEE